ncbi:MAG: hypothetical protein J6L91_07470 [Clostridia bacterium]|nr:hypothetical protein [Clostridia bacterium]
MDYVDVKYYRENHNGKINEIEEISEKLLLAEIKIDELTFNRIRARGFNNLTPFQQEKIKQAVCRQADYIHENGYDEEGVQSYSVLDISVSMSNSNGEASRLMIDPVALALLRQTGLMCRRI